MDRPARQVVWPSSWIWNRSRPEKPPGRAAFPRCVPGGSATTRRIHLGPPRQRPDPSSSRSQRQGRRPRGCNLGRARPRRAHRLSRPPVVVRPGTDQGGDRRPHGRAAHVRRHAMAWERKCWGKSSGPAEGLRSCSCSVPRCRRVRLPRGAWGASRRGSPAPPDSPWPCRTRREAPAGWWSACVWGGADATRGPAGKRCPPPMVVDPAALAPRRSGRSAPPPGRRRRRARAGWCADTRWCRRHGARRATRGRAPPG